MQLNILANRVTLHYITCLIWEGTTFVYAIFILFFLSAMAVQELGKDRPIGRTSESHTSSFLKTVNEIENNLIKQINYLYQVSTTHPHTGSGYGAHKDWLVSLYTLCKAAHGIFPKDRDIWITPCLKHLALNRNTLANPGSHNENELPTYFPVPHT